MLKEGYEDFFRHKADRTVNNAMTQVFDKDSLEFVEVRWRDVHVGDIVKILDGEAIPADMLLVATSHPEGLAFVDTMQLDGETNLKERLAL